MRQQRPARNRRQLTLQAPQRLPLITIEGALITGPHTMIIQFGTMSYPPTVGVVNCEMQIHGLPKIIRAFDLAFCSAIVPGVDPVTVEVTFPGTNLNDTDTFAIGPYDPALRTSQGGFVVPSIFQALVE